MERYRYRGYGPGGGRAKLGSGTPTLTGPQAPTVIGKFGIYHLHCADHCTACHKGAVAQEISLATKALRLALSDMRFVVGREALRRSSC